MCQKHQKHISNCYYNLQDQTVQVQRIAVCIMLKYIALYLCKTDVSKYWEITVAMVPSAVGGGGGGHSCRDKRKCCGLVYTQYSFIATTLLLLLIYGSLVLYNILLIICHVPSSSKQFFRKKYHMFSQR